MSKRCAIRDRAGFEVNAGLSAGLFSDETRRENKSNINGISNLPALPGFFFNCEGGELINVYYLSHLPYRARKMTRQSRRNPANRENAYQINWLALPGFSKTNPAGGNRV